MATPYTHSYAVFVVFLRQKRFKINRINTSKSRLIGVKSLNTLENIRRVSIWTQTLVLHTLFRRYWFFLTIVIWSLVWLGPLWGHRSNTHPLTRKDQDTLHLSGIGRYHDLCSRDSLHPPAPEQNTVSWVYHSNVMSSRNTRYKTASVSQKTLYEATKHGYMLPMFTFKELNALDFILHDGRWC